MASATNTNPTSSVISRDFSARETEGLPKRTRLVVSRMGLGRIGGALLIGNTLALFLVALAALGITAYREAVITERMELAERQAVLVRAAMTDEALGLCRDGDCLRKAGRARAVLAAVSGGFDGRLTLFAGENGALEPIASAGKKSSSEAAAVPVPAALPKSALPETLGRGLADGLKSLVFDLPLRGRLSSETIEEDARRLTEGRVGSVRALRRGGDSGLVASVALPVRAGGTVRAVVVAERFGVDAVGAKLKASLLPLVILVFALSSFSAMTLTAAVTQPLRQLSAAAEKVRSSIGNAEKVRLPDLDHRHDDVGRLSRSFRAMTKALVDRIQSIDSFAADVSHELKNPLTSIRSAVETMDRCRTDEQRKRLLEVIAVDVERMDRLISDISSASRLDAQLATENRRAIPAARLVGDIVHSYRAVMEAGGPIVSFWDDLDGKPVVYGAPSSLGRVLRNLIDNAVSFSPKSGAVAVALEKSPRARQLVRITVTDEGPGVPMENLESIFDRFYTSRPSGTTFGENSGLGLAIARQIIESHGGKIWCENVEDDNPDRTGARFLIELPIHKGSTG